MKGTMMQSPLSLTSLLERAGELFSKVEIVSRRPDNWTHHYTCGDFYRRARAFAKWQLPDDFVFVPELPHTSPSKLLKSALRRMYGDWN